MGTPNFIMLKCFKVIQKENAKKKDDILSSVVSSNFVSRKNTLSIIFAIFVLINTICSVSFSQVTYNNDQNWKWVHQTPQGNNLYWCKMWDANTWYMAGTNSTFMKTTDRGITWYINTKAGRIISPQGKNKGIVGDAIFFDRMNGILVTEGGLMRTTNGGNSFDSIPGFYVANQLITRIVFLNNNTGYITLANPGGKIAKTTNGGNTWVTNTTIPITSYYDLYTPNDTLIIASSTLGNIRRSTDGGATWTTISTGASSTLNKLAFINRDTGIVCGTSTAVRLTTNGGLNWVSINSGLPTAGFYDIDIRTVGSTREIYLTGTLPAIYKSTNFGATWVVVQTIPPSQTFTNLYRSTDLANTGDSLITVGHFGLINTRYGPSDISQRCLFLKAGNSNMCMDIYAETGSGKVWTVGAPTTPGITFDQVLFSSNGGNNWTVQTVTNSSSTYYSISMLNASTGYICGTVGAIRKTTNGGLSWDDISITTTFDLNKIDFINANTGWVFGGLVNDAGCVFKTTDGGINWLQQSADTNINSADMLDANTGWMVTLIDFDTSKVYKTTNGGTNWLLQGSAQLLYVFDIEMLDNNTGYVCGQQGDANTTGKVCKTTNGGQSWTPITTPFPSGTQFMDVDFLNPLVGMVSDISYTIKTTNGGQNWIIDALPSPMAYNGKMCMVATDTIFATGFSGGIFKYSNGTTGITEWQNIIPEKIEIYQNYPNPFNPTTTIKFAIPKSGSVSLKVYDITGRQVKTLLDNLELNAGTIKHEFDGSNLASGTYFYSLYIDRQLIATKRMVLIK